MPRTGSQTTKDDTNAGGLGKQTAGSKRAATEGATGDQARQRLVDSTEAAAVEDLPWRVAHYYNTRHYRYIIPPYESPIDAFLGALSSPTVVIVIGPEKQSFTAHEGLLAHHSLFFRENCFTCPAIAGIHESKKRIDLPKWNAQTFEYFMHWLYTHHTLGPTSFIQFRTSSGVIEGLSIYESAKLYKMAEIAGAEALTKDLDAYIGARSADLLPEFDQDRIQQVYACTHEGHILRKIAIEKFAEKGNHGSIGTEDLKKYPKDFVVGIYQALVRMRDAVAQTDAAKVAAEVASKTAELQQQLDRAVAAKDKALAANRDLRAGGLVSRIPRN